MLFRSFVMITSKARLEKLDQAPAEGEGPGVSVQVASGAKCERCWHYADDVGQHAEPTLCGRCTSNLFGTGERRSIA